MGQLERRDIRPLSYPEFRTVARANARTLSRDARPGLAESAQQYSTTVRDLLAEPVYPVWFVGKSGGEEVPYNSPEAQPILFRDLAKRADLVGLKLTGWPCPHFPEPTAADLVTLYCTGCGRHVVLDGNHRLLWLAVASLGAAPVHVTELSGRSWPTGTPDLNVICVCSQNDAEASA